MKIEEAVGLNVQEKTNDIKTDENVKSEQSNGYQQQQEPLLRIVNTEMYQNAPTMESNNNYETIDLSQYVE